MKVRPAGSVGAARLVEHGQTKLYRYLVSLTTRQVVVALAIVALVSLSVVGDIWSTPVAYVAFLALGAAAIFAFIEAYRRSADVSGPQIVAPTEYPKTWLSVVALGVGSAVAVQMWFRGGMSIAGGDITPPDGGAWVSRLFNPWVWSGSNLGGPSLLDLRLPWAAILGAIQSLGGSAALGQRIWYTVLFSGAGLAMFALLRVLQIDRVAALAGACVYIFNPFVVSTVNINPVYLAALALLPAFPAVLIAAGARRIRIRTAALLLGAAAPLVGYIYLNPPLAGLILTAMIATPALIYAVYGRTAGARALKALGVGFALMIGIGAYWIVPAILEGTGLALGQLADPASWQWTEARASIKNGFWLNTIWAWNFPEYFPFAQLYERFPLSALRFGLPALAFGALLIGRSEPRLAKIGKYDVRLRLSAFAASGALMVIFLSTGTNPPGSLVFNFLYNLPLGWLLREPGRFLVAAGLLYAVLVAISLDCLLARLSGRRLLPVVAVGGAAAIILLPGYPLITGAVAADSGPGLRSTHVLVPEYWKQMAKFVDTLPVDGGLLVLPPDDFYQMPYVWGYYGSDGFISELFHRPVLVPNSAGYAPAQRQVINIVDTTAQSLIASQWDEAGRLVGVLRTPLVLVRGDIDSTVSGRRIVPPSALQNALQRSPNFDLIYKAGPLELFKARAGAPPSLERTPTFLTVNSSEPDLRILTVLPQGSALISESQQAGTAAVLQAPAISRWSQDGTRLTWQTVAPGGWRYVMVALDSGGYGGPVSLTGPSTGGSSLPKFLTGELKQREQGAAVTVTATGQSVIADGSFENGLWQPVGDCDNLLGEAAAPFLRADVSPTGGPNQAPYLRLSATVDSACEATRLTWHGGAVLLSVMSRHVAGAPTRLCLWETGADRCAALPDLPQGDGWTPYRATAVPDPGTTALSVFLYADVFTRGERSINDYASVQALELPSLPQVDIIGTPDPSSVTHPQQLVTLHQAYSRDWRADGQHVLVNGVLNGWLLAHPNDSLRVSYTQSEALQLAYLITGIAVASALVLVISLLPFRRWRRLSDKVPPVRTPQEGN